MIISYHLQKIVRLGLFSFFPSSPGGDLLRFYHSKGLCLLLSPELAAACNLSFLKNAIPIPGLPLKVLGPSVCLDHKKHTPSSGRSCGFSLCKDKFLLYYYLCFALCDDMKNIKKNFTRPYLCQNAPQVKECQLSLYRRSQCIRARRPLKCMLASPTRRLSQI